jgi:hypothetical protein
MHTSHSRHILSTASSVGIKNILQVDRYFSGSPNTPSDCRHLAGVDWDQRAQKRAVYQIVGNGHKGWSPNVDKELGNYDYLLGSDVGLVRHIINRLRLTQVVGRLPAPRCPGRYAQLVRLDFECILLLFHPTLRSVDGQLVRPQAALASVSMPSSTWTASFFWNG